MESCWQEEDQSNVTLLKSLGLPERLLFKIAEIASNYDVIEDLVQKIMLYVHKREETRKEELKKDLIEKHFTKYLGIMEKKNCHKWDTRGMDVWVKGHLSRLLSDCSGRDDH